MTAPLPSQGSTSWYGWAQWLDGMVRNPPPGYTDEQVRDVVAAMVKAGANVTVTNDDAANTLTIAATTGGAGGTTDPEVVRDTIASALVAGTNVTITPDDTANTITISAAGTGGSGVTDHGALTGLGDDDHPQYLNNARGDARYATTGHTHTAAQVGAVQAATTNLKLWKGTRAAYDAISTKDSNTVYVIAG